MLYVILYYSIYIIGMIHYLFPKALVIHIQRDPMDTMLQCYTDYKLSSYTGMQWVLNEDDMVFEYLQYLQLMDHYRSTLPDKIIDVSYEEVYIYNMYIVLYIYIIL